MSDPEITPTEPDGPGENPDDGTGDGADRDRPDGNDIRLPEEQEAGDETVAADTASGGAPEPAGDDAGR
ncbi:hypothetical protein [Agromyces mariniharenae]|uniref:Uncharacterized protein n=1 Tax=Agromyces mariniharenae TaxID=2604423 RepID=A0A5S4V653_9MICO|nr:hypothetical protein [Agromyces mariniharenae]TYL53519.1 hypothetical protein FYC51_07590 [Agromyces mariniharenae]